jgi:tRNA uridine 5-carbamoylmethylation protein Kti12
VGSFNHAFNNEGGFGHASDRAISPKKRFVLVGLDHVINHLIAYEKDHFNKSAHQKCEMNQHTQIHLQSSMLTELQHASKNSIKKKEREAHISLIIIETTALLG